MSNEISGGGMPDGWQRLWAPHRLEYLRGENRPLPGNLVICPFCEIPSKTDEEGLSEQERDEIYRLTAHAMQVIRKVSSPQGFNLGMNQGEVSGAGIAEHIHQHVVPRWGGDANFMPIIGKTKVMPQLLSLTRDEIAAAW